MTFDATRDVNEFKEGGDGEPKILVEVSENPELETKRNDEVVNVKKNRVKRDWHAFGFEIYEEATEDIGRGTVCRIVIPYWSIVIPLTLLSVWLLLSKPRVAGETTTES